ncbi:MAG: sugar-binding protein [Planctomycetota bacterium]|nr:sugar-binding protein [Planctomycetota bacterium]
MRRKPFTVVLLVLVGAIAAIALAKSASVLLREGLYAEEVEGDLDAAIGVYRQIVADASAPREQVAQALYRLGMCHMKRKDELEARAAFSKLAADYGDQTQLIEKVRPLLEELGNADPAALMPSGTVAYVEIGSPGKQIETILNMLKDTPFENPLAMIGHGASGDAVGPQQIISSLLNPSMMAEFKKIRSMGIGITEVTQSNPPTIVVLYPGRSDALRGIIQMALGLVGRSAPAIEGMTTLTFGAGGGAAYDDTVIIVATPSPKGAELLQWSVKQYKGLIKEPSLASSNKSFAKIGKKARQDSMLTVWVNADEAYQALQKILPADAMPAQLRMADGMADFKNIDDVIASLSIRPTGLALDANVNLKDGHNCLAYNLIRTPPLRVAALNALPSDAIALFSVALGRSDTAQAAAAGEQIKNVTGLDIGRELFDNIEQVTLFAVPFRRPTEQLSEDIPPQVKSFGLAITSVNPQQTHQILSSVLRAVNVVIDETQPAGGRFDFTLPNYQKFFGYMDPASKTTVLSLDSSLVETSVAAMKQPGGAVKGGPLQSVLGTLPAATSKLIALNVAGAVRFAEANMDLPEGEVGNRVREALAQLAQASAKTTVRLQTSEEANSFGVRLSIDDLPPIPQLIGPISQIADTMSQIHGRHDQWGGMQPVLWAGIAPTDRAPVIDGKIDEAWASARQYKLEHSFYDPVSDDTDCSAWFKTLYDKDNLYVLVEVADDDLRSDSAEFWLDDGVEIFLSADNRRLGAYGDNDYQYYFKWHPRSPVMGESKHEKTDGVEFAFAGTDAGYRLEVRFPWAMLGATPSAGTTIGFDVQVNDDDGGGDRNSKIAWNAVQDDAWQNTRAFGVAQPLGLVAWWKLDESSGDEARDASGNERTGRLEGGPTWQPTGGKIGGALMFDGQDDYVDTGYNTDSPTWTIAVWVKSPSVPSGDKQTGPVHREKNYQINWDHMDDPFRGAAGVYVNAQWHAASFGPLEEDTWYHLAATYDGETLRVYKNGVFVTENADPSGVPDHEEETLKLGCHALTLAGFAGTVDEVRLYNYALESPEIARLAGK